jgi:hypothetical protein
VTAERPVPELPEPTFDVLVQLLAGPAFVHLGLVQNPATGRLEPDRVQAKWVIDLLHVLEERTRGNLDDAERARVTQLLHQLRSAYAERR